MAEMPDLQKEDVLSRFMERLDPWIRGAAALFLLITGLLFLFDMVCRLLLNRTYEWTLELAIASIIFSVFLASGPAYKRGQHIAMTIVSELLGKDRFRPIQFMLHVIIVLFCFIMTWQGTVYAMKSVSMGTTSGALDPFPIGYFKLSIPIGMVFFTLFAVSAALKEGIMIFSPGSRSKDISIE